MKAMGSVGVANEQKRFRKTTDNLNNSFTGFKSGYEVAACNKTIYIDNQSNMLKVKQLLTSLTYTYLFLICTHMIFSYLSDNLVSADIKLNYYRFSV